MINIQSNNDFSNLTKFIKDKNKVLDRLDVDSILNEGVLALSNATPVDTGKTANSWFVAKERTKNGLLIKFNNSNIQNGANIAILLQYGHGTKNGGYVQGRDYINPTLRPIFDKILERLREEVNK